MLGEIKIVGLLLLSAAVLPGESSQFTARMTAGCVLAMLGFCLYTHAKMAASRKSAGAAAASQKAAQQDRIDIEEGQPLLKVLASRACSRAVYRLCNSRTICSCTHTMCAHMTMQSLLPSNLMTPVRKTSSHGLLMCHGEYICLVCWRQNISNDQERVPCRRMAGGNGSSTSSRKSSSSRQ